MTTRGFEPSGRRLVRLAPGRVEVVRARLDLGRRRSRRGGTRAGRPSRAASRARSPRSCPASAAIAASDSPSALEADPVVADEIVQVPDGRVEPFQLGAEPRMRALRQLPGVGAVELAGAARLEERLAEGAADAHRLADRLHLRAERRVRARELLEGEARELDDDVVERRLEARRRRPGQVVRDLVERVADGELGRDLGDRIAGRLRRQRGGARDARVHLDHP